MPSHNIVTQHYTHGSLIETIQSGVEKLGKSVSDVSVDDLAPVDEFHIGGRMATQAFLSQLNIDPTHKVLDVGCGLGGSSRFVAQQYGCQVTGIDLTQEFVDTGNTLCAWVGLTNKVQLKVENALALSDENESYDRVYLMHVGMNIADKKTLATELFRILKPGGKLGIYDVMRVNKGALKFPVPWASEPGGSSVASLPEYLSALQSAGFHVIKETNRRAFALQFFSELQTRIANAGGPPPLGLHLLMGDKAPLKMNNMLENISQNLVAPIEIIAEK
ncbi:SAM-dependent methyltransferase [Thalassotalea litorea]|uniref:SAM-dependent methyltransferase n=1 Tax=Thalassotalea litorea TaxID=2020715 RepID=UPI0037363C0E